ncbi:MAG: tetratricopeptide repeat protein [Anaerolineales bacterium]|nr:tetratricopeptide repeat protein [Anaerolineales bacterium]
MQINRRSSSYPRRGGPSCLTMIVFVVVAGAVFMLASNANTVIEAIVPTPTPEPTRSAASYATSASLYQRDGEYEQAISSYENAIQLDSENPAYYVALINLLTLTNQPDDALYWAERVILLESGNDEVLSAVAAAYLLNGRRLAEVGELEEADLQYQRAIDSAQQATQINGNSGLAYAYLAGALIAQNPNNFARAQEVVDLAVALEPDNPVVRYYRGVVLETQGYYAQAIDEYETAVSLDATYVDPALSLAYSYFYSDNRQRAIIILRDLIEANPTDANTHDALGWFYFLAGQYPDAEIYLEEAVRLDPEMVRARAHLGATYFRQFNYLNAIPELEMAVENFGGVTPTRALFYNMLGFSHFRQDGNCQAAVPLFQQVIELDTNDINEDNARQGLEDCRQANIEESE